jgi:hypothetical protein
MGSVGRILEIQVHCGPLCRSAVLQWAQLAGYWRYRFTVVRCVDQLCCNGLSWPDIGDTGSFFERVLLSPTCAQCHYPERGSVLSLRQVELFELIIMKVQYFH